MLSDSEKYVIYGAGKTGRMVFDYLGAERVVAFCDSNKKTGDVYFCDKSIISIEEVKRLYSDLTAVVAVTRAKDGIEIIEKLRKAGIQYKYYTDLMRFIDQDRELYESMNARQSFKYDEKFKYEILTDKFRNAGSIGDYFWQDIWAAKKVFQEKDVRNSFRCYDIGSRLDGFIAHLLAGGIEVTMIDIRPLPYHVPGLNFIQADATSMKGIKDESIECLTALCSLEHFGLGRYGDSIDPEACFKCFRAIQKKVKRGGKIYISVPIGAEHLEFNAHRIFNASTIINEFSDCNLIEFSTCRNAEFEENVEDIHKFDMEYSRGARFGLFAFEKY